MWPSVLFSAPASSTNLKWLSRAELLFWFVGFLLLLLLWRLCCWHVLFYGLHRFLRFSSDGSDFVEMFSRFQMWLWTVCSSKTVALWIIPYDCGILTLYGILILCGILTLCSIWPYVVYSPYVVYWSYLVYWPYVVYWVNKVNITHKVNIVDLMWYTDLMWYIDLIWYIENTGNTDFYFLCGE